jgi:nitrite reductase/ring-hydroxylating ferredoxin subunit
MAKEIFVAKSAELKDGQSKLVIDGKTEIGVYRLKGKLYAYLNLCPHQGGPACEGMLIAKVEEDLNPDMTSNGLKFNDDEIHIVCPWHGFEFKVETGEHAGDPKWKLRKFPVTEKGGDIYVTA